MTQIQNPDIRFIPLTICACSFYRLSANMVNLVYFSHVDKDSAFKALINDVNHEITHHILNKLIDSESSIKYDNTKLQYKLHIGFNTEEEYMNLIIHLLVGN